MGTRASTSGISAEPDPNQFDATHRLRNKMQIIVGEAQGDGLRSMQRLEKYMAQAEAMDCPIPEGVEAFIRDRLDAVMVEVEDVEEE